VTYRLPSERVPVTVSDLTIEVERIGAWAVAHHATVLVGTYYAAKPGAPELEALRAAYAFFIEEAEPSWDIADHKGRIPVTAGGMLRLPVALALGLVYGWAQTVVEKTSAVDELIPEGELRDSLNAQLKAKRRKAA